MPISASRGLLACPVCAGALDLGERSLGCGRGHRFDVARQGYVNLLGAPPPANADSTAMVASRDRFLSRGLFRPIADEVADRLAPASVVVEAGAGTGYYLGAVLDRNPAARGVAVDVSVAAARRAARSHERAASVVADVWSGLPVLSHRATAVLCVFAPRNFREFARVLTRGGLVVVVAPTASHLAGLRRRYGLLGIEPDKDGRLLRSASEHLEPVCRSVVDYTASASADDVRDLIAMGPNAFHGPRGDAEPTDVHVSVAVWLFRAGPGAP